METRSNNVLVGAVVLALLAALAVFIVWLSGNAKGNTKPYDIFFTQSVDGLAKGGAVSFSGVPSGQITEIELWKNDPQFVRVRIEVKDETPVLQGTTATIQGSFTGPSTIILDGAVKGAPPITAEGPAGVPVIPPRAGGFGALLNSAPKLLQNVTELTDRLNKLLSPRNRESISDILDNTNRLTDALADRGPEIAATIADTRIAIRQAGDAIEKIGNLADSTNGQLNPLLGDLRKTVQSADKSMQTLDDTLKDARPGVQNFSKNTLPEIGQATRDLRQLTESLSNVAQRLDQEGAAGLIGQPKLPDYKGKK
jgi:phospholipid/cholesterol/gamma-HCH transport system substrate-binding protein